MAVSQSKGALRWRFPAFDVLGIHLTNTPAVANGVVFVTGEGSVVALDGITGRKIRSYRRGICLTSRPE